MAKNNLPTNEKSLLDYCDLFSKLKVNKSKQRGEAPYKPILVLSIIDLITQDVIKDNHIYITDELIETFNKYWTILNPESFNGGLSLPFFHLKNDGFWKLQFSVNYDGGRPQTLPKLKEDVDYAIIDKNLFNFLQEQLSKEKLLDTIIETWFSSSHKELNDILKINQDLQEVSTKQEEFLENVDKLPKTYLKKSFVRNAFFRKAVVHLYDYKCSLCQLKVIQSLTQSIVDGAHIKPFAKFYDNKIDNGISLCKNHHWAFDQGLFSIDDEYKVIVADSFEEEAPNSKPVKEFHGTSILLPNSKIYYPRLEAIRWHRQNIYRK